MSMPEWPENKQPPPINQPAHLSQFNLSQPSGNVPSINYSQLGNLGQQSFQQQAQQDAPGSTPRFPSPFTPAINGLKRQREPSGGGVSPKTTSSPRARNVNIQQGQQQPQQMQNHVIFPNQPNLQPQQSPQNFQQNQIRPQPPQMSQQQIMATFANMPPHIQQRFANLPPHQLQQQLQQLQQQLHMQQLHQQQQVQQAQQQQSQQQQGQQQQQAQSQQQPLQVQRQQVGQQQSQPGQQVRPNVAGQQGAAFPIQPAPNRFAQQQQQGQGMQQGLQFPNQQQLNQNPALANQMQATLAQNQQLAPQLYQQRLLQQQHQNQLAQSGSPPNVASGLPQQFQNQAQHPGLAQLSNQAGAGDASRSPALRNLQGPKSASSPHQTPRSAPPSTPQSNQIPLQPQPAQTPQQLQPGAPGPRPNKEAFLHSLHDYMARRGTPIQSTPFVGSRQIDLFALYVAVMKEGGFQPATNKGAWGRVAVQNNFSAQDHSVPNQLAELYKMYLLPFEEAFQKAKLQKAQMASGQARPPGLQPQQPGPPQGGMQGTIQPAMQHVQQSHQPPPILPQTQHQAPIPSPHGTPQGMLPPHMQQMQNGMVPPQMQQMQQHQPLNMMSNHLQQRMPIQPQANIQRPMFQQPPHPQHPNKVPIPSASPVRKPSLESTPQPPSRQSSVSKTIPRKPPYQPKKRNVDTHGGWHLHELIRFGGMVASLRPSVPPLQELGAVDVHALTMSLRSGLPGEVTNALDILSVMLNDNRILSLAECWDLLDVLLEVGDEAIEILEEGLRTKRKRLTCTSPTREKKTFLDFEHYHDLVQSCQGLSEDLDELVGGPESDSPHLKVEAERVLCITALIRNFSFAEFNHEILAGEDVVRFCTRLLHGIHESKTRPFMVTKRNNLELIRDIITLLSNVGHCIRLPDFESAQLIYSAILSFTHEDHARMDPVLIFSPYKPGRDTYLPAALDALAKLLVVDRPNKEHFVTLLRSTTDKSEGGKFTRGDIYLTNAFGMAISALPTNESAQAFFSKEDRAALAEQGMLAATALVEMLPNDGELARYWLSSKDNFGARLVRIVFHLAAIHDQRLPPGIPANGGMYSHITRRGMKIVETMTSRAMKGVKEGGEGVPMACSKKEQLLGAMLTGTMDGAIVESLWRLHDIEEITTSVTNPGRLAGESAVLTR